MENALHRPCVGGSSDWPATPMEQKRNVLLSTDLASVGAATFKLILLENNPIDSFVSCPLPLTQGQWRACLSAIKPGGSFSLPPTRGRHWQATFSGILPGFKTFWVLFPVVSLRSTTGYLLQSRRDKYARQAEPASENRYTPKRIDRFSSGLRCDHLCLTHHSQEVSAHDLMDLSRSIAAVEHLLCDHRIRRNVVQLFWKQ